MLTKERNLSESKNEFSLLADPIHNNRYLQPERKGDSVDESIRIGWAGAYLWDLVDRMVKVVN